MGFVENMNLFNTQLPPGGGLDGQLTQAWPNGQIRAIENLTKDWSAGETSPLRFSADEDLRGRCWS